MMRSALLRKISQVRSDPVLRQWLWQRLAHKTFGPEAHTANAPPYLARQLPLSAYEFHLPQDALELDTNPPTGSISIPLPGIICDLSPENPDSIFHQKFDDLEAFLAVHRFAWLPLLGAAVDPAWVQTLFSSWRRLFLDARDDWPWHPYTASERAINILDYAERKGFPAPLEETIDILAIHGEEIAGNLEYQGDHYTSNHLSNNGRALLRIGLALGISPMAELGMTILENEADRLFLPSGFMREGSTHYHVLITRNYLDAWLAAEVKGYPGAEILKDIGIKALQAMQTVLLPGGMPLIGDISPDSPPDFLSGLAAGSCPWIEWLDPKRRDILRSSTGSFKPPHSEPSSSIDGWLRADYGPWSGLWSIGDRGWSPMPGHGHQDCGSFEIHYKTIAVFVDPGRGVYGDGQEAQEYVGARVHNGLTVDGAGPFPKNRPYYNDPFRRRVAGPSPKLSRTKTCVSLYHNGFPQGRKITSAKRVWNFSENGFQIIDRIDGEGRHAISRQLITPLAAKSTEGGAVVLEAEGQSFRISASEGPLHLRPLTQWTAYGMGRPAMQIFIEMPMRIPTEATLTVDVA